MLLRDLLDLFNLLGLLGLFGRRQDRAARAHTGSVHGGRHLADGTGDRGEARDGHDAEARRERLAGMVAGWGRALRLLPSFARGGPPAVAPPEVARLSRLAGEAE